MTIPPLWIAILAACVLAVPLLLRVGGLRADATNPGKPHGLFRLTGL